MMSKVKLESLLEFVNANGRICPNPREWQHLWDILPGKTRLGQSWDPPHPLILAAWKLPGLPKILRLKEHIQYAYKYGSG